MCSGDKHQDVKKYPNIHENQNISINQSSLMNKKYYKIFYSHNH